MAGTLSDADLTPVAGGGLLDRRLFLTGGLVVATAQAAAPVRGGEASGTKPEDPADPPWLHDTGGPFTGYGTPSKYEKYVVRNIGGNRTPAGEGVSWTPLEDLEGIITPSGLHFERHHDGVPDIDPAQHRLVIHGLVQQPLEFTVESLLRYPMRSRFLFIECGGNSNAGWHEEPIQRPVGAFHGLVSCSEWTGVPLSILLDEAGVDLKASWVIAEGADAGLLNVSLPLSKLMDDAMIGLYQNGERVRPENGYPIRLIVPGWEGITNIKWLWRLHVADQPAMTRNETAKYTELLPSGRARMFTFVMDAKSVITSPSPQAPVRAKGFMAISGLAWSGRGKIKRVDVSLDGGRNWRAARIDGPVFDKACVRFYSETDWNGEPLLLQSRAIDETGYVQPTKDDLRKIRGVNSIYHNNGIQTWALKPSGEVENVEVG
ncbi:MAG TPA: sulfite dehydrogenase [Hyphomicrobium sp.]